MSSTEDGSISARQELWLIGPDVVVPLACDLRYRRRDPYAVTMSLDADQAEPVEWTFSRDLLAAALDAPEGIGDVRAWPSRSASGGRGKTLNIELGPPDGCARFEVSAAEIGAFLARSYELVPAGGEPGYLNLDAELAEFLSQA